MKVKVLFEVEKETKRTFRFAEVENDMGPAPVIGTLYLQKFALKQMAIDGKVPTKVTVVFEVTG